MEPPQEIMKVDVGDRWIIYIWLEPDEIDCVNLYKQMDEDKYRFFEIKRRRSSKKRGSEQ